MKSSVEMHAVVAMVLVMATQGVVPGCYEFCKVICALSHRPLVLWRSDCDCSDLHKSEINEPTSLFENSGIYFEPDEQYAHQSIPLADQPFYVLNPITMANPNTIKSRNKIRGRDTVIKEVLSHDKVNKIKSDRKLAQKTKSNNYLGYERHMESSKLPLYLDIDILESTDGERAFVQELVKSEVEDFRLLEKNLSECINLHLLFNSRKGGNAIKIKLNADIRHLENISDSDLKIEIEKKCIQSASVVRRGLHEIKEALPKKFNKSGIEDILANKESIQRHASNISKEPDFKRIETLVSDNNTITSQDINLPVTSISRTMNNNPDNMNEDEKKMINTKQKEKDRKYLRTTKISTPSPQTTVNDTGSETKSLNNSNEKTQETKYSTAIENISVHDYAQSTDSATISFDKLITNNPIIYPDDVGNSSRNLKKIGNHNIVNKDDLIGPVDVVELRTLVASTTEKIIKKSFTESDTGSTIMTPLITDYLLGSNRFQSNIINTTNTKTYSDQNINILTNQDKERQNIKNVSNDVGSHADSDKAFEDTIISKTTNRSEYLEGDIQIPKIITREYSNDTVTSILSGNELLPNLDFVKDGDNMEQTMDYITTQSDAKQLRRLASTSASTESLEKSKIKGSQEINVFQPNTSEVTGKLYFLYGQQQLPARFVQSSDGKLTIGIDGFSMCNDLTQKAENKSVLMTTLCKCALSQNCTSRTSLTDEVFIVSNN